MNGVVGQPVSRLDGYEKTTGNARYTGEIFLPNLAYAAIKSRDKRLGLCIDVGHTTRTGTDPVQACRECRDRLYDMHVKDLASKSEKESQVEVGRGVIDFPALFRTLIEIGYQGQVGLEYEINAKNPLPGMIESMAFMRGVLAALAT